MGLRRLQNVDHSGPLSIVATHTPPVYVISVECGTGLSVTVGWSVGHCAEIALPESIMKIDAVHLHAWCRITVSDQLEELHSR